MKYRVFYTQIKGLYLEGQPICQDFETLEDVKLFIMTLTSGNYNNVKWIKLV